MKAFLVDTYRYKGKISAWLQLPNGKNIVRYFSFQPTIYVRKTPQTTKLLSEQPVETKKEYTGEQVEVFVITVNHLERYEKIVRWIELTTKYKALLYNADISPEQEFLYKHNITPCSWVQLQTMTPLQGKRKKLHSITLEIKTEYDIRKYPNTKLQQILIGEKGFKGNERGVIVKFIEEFKKIDPDIIIMDHSYLKIPFIMNKIKMYGFDFTFHRFDPIAINYSGGKSFYSYGRVHYKDFPTRLHGRFLVDNTAVVAEQCDDEGIMELCELSGSHFQTVASRSFGSVFQGALLREMYRRKLLIPYKQKPVDKPLNLHTMIKADRVGIVLDPEIGLHYDVAEIDFSSMFPHIIYEQNVSAETIGEQGITVPGLPLSIKHDVTGIVPAAVKPLIDRRIQHKNQDSTRRIVQGLKGVLVTSYGYLRFREFKLGTASSHMTIGAYARELLIKAIQICEEEGFEVIHGIVDSLYIKRQGITKSEVDAVCKRISEETNIPMFNEGLFKWVVFLPSITNDKKPVPTKYYGVRYTGELKLRGIEARQKSTCKLVQFFQHHCVRSIAKGHNPLEHIPYLFTLLKATIRSIPYVDESLLTCKITISKTHYKNNSIQQQLLRQLRYQTILPGMTLKYIHSIRGVIPEERYTGKPDIRYYSQQLVRAVYVLLQPFGWTRSQIEMNACGQTTLLSYQQEQEVALPVQLFSHS